MVIQEGGDGLDRREQVLAGAAIVGVDEVYGFVVLGLLRPSRPRVPTRELPVLAVLGLTGVALLQWLYFVAIDLLPVGVALLLEFTCPLLIAVFSSVVLRQVVDRRVGLALGLSLGGRALVAQVWRDVGLDPVGVAACLAAAACLATFYLLGSHTLVLTSVQLLGGGLVLLGVGLVQAARAAQGTPATARRPSSRASNSAAGTGRDQ